MEQERNAQRKPLFEAPPRDWAQEESREFLRLVLWIQRTIHPTSGEENPDSWRLLALVVSFVLQ